MAPHLFVEDISVAGIQAARTAYAGTNLSERLGRYHNDVDGVFRGWNNIWLNTEFRRWNIEASVTKITCPILAIQGYDDEYGTMAQIDRIAALTPRTQLLKLERCRHSPHRDNPEAVLSAAAAFYFTEVNPRYSQQHSEPDGHGDVP
jgi:pimeloyl-ACP methyl ester carboxylesterase